MWKDLMLHSTITYIVQQYYYILYILNILFIDVFTKFQYSLKSRNIRKKTFGLMCKRTSNI